MALRVVALLLPAFLLLGIPVRSQAPQFVVEGLPGWITLTEDTPTRITVDVAFQLELKAADEGKESPQAEVWILTKDGKSFERVEKMGGIETSQGATRVAAHQLFVFKRVDANSPVTALVLKAGNHFQVFPIAKN